MQALIKNIKENNQDFEFYPTTKEMINIIYQDLGSTAKNSYKHYSILDIGCGNGNFFSKFDELTEEATITERYGIEKSEILINQLPDDVIIVGTDFEQNTLLDKKVDVIFCNPPYSNYEQWTHKIIEESFCKTIYLIIPTRWKNSDAINNAIKNRGFKTQTLATMDFNDAERKARATVDIIKIYKSIDYMGERYYHEKEENDPFNAWFDKEFKVDLDKKETCWTEEQKKRESEKEKINNLVKGNDLIQVLSELYQDELNRLLTSYKSISQIDPEILKQLGANVDNLKTGLKEKIEGVKNKYWHELFDRLEKINNKLTSKKRKDLLDKIYKNTSVDFTPSNAYAVVLWVIKNANKYYNEQLIDMYKRLTEKEYIKRYKSNQRTWEKEGWRYNADDFSHYTLEYRVITQDYKDYRGHSDLIGDIRVIANNLGFTYIGDIKEFKNGNVHFKFERDFLKAFNIEAARLLGWIKSKEDAVNEMEDITPEDADKYFKSNFLIESNVKQLLLTSC